MSSYAPFASASSEDSIPTPNSPTAYGYNVLVFNESTAVLDMPISDYLTTAQGTLQGSDFWTIKASVSATVSRYNTTFEFRNNTNFWDYAFGNNSLYSSALNDPALNSIGFLSGSASTDGTYCLVGFYNSGQQSGGLGGISSSNNSTSPDSSLFRSSAMMFNIRREKCSGTWQVNHTTVSLIDGACDGELTDQSVFSEVNAEPYWLDFLPVWDQTLVNYASSRRQSPWLIPAFTTSVATCYWARIAYLMRRPLASPNIGSDGVLYTAVDEKIISTRHSLQVARSLYLLLAVQPFLTLAMFLLCATLYSTPIGKGFGLVAVLSGVEKESLSLIFGAGLSGNVEKPIKLIVSVVDDQSRMKGERVKRIQYSIGGDSRETKGLKKGEVYK